MTPPSPPKNKKKLNLKKSTYLGRLGGQVDNASPFIPLDHSSSHDLAHVDHCLYVNIEQPAIFFRKSVVLILYKWLLCHRLHC